jgi:hypothetical protein
MQKVEGSNPFSRFPCDRRPFGRRFLYPGLSPVKKSDAVPVARRLMSIYATFGQSAPAILDFDAPAGICHDFCLLLTDGR